jgi:Asp-tRNA(Asn)/Glu-tRNA(Gln) amidotransferase A subunit family amidase
LATEPCDLSARAARALIGSKRLSPVELVDSCIARIEAIDHAVNAVVARDFERARVAARAAEAAVTGGVALGPLHGLPFGVKDLENTEGLRTTFGSERFRDHVPDRDDGLVARVRAAGGIVLGKTNTPEFGAGANTRNAVYGATGNPFDPSRSCAGSSGGSAVALATGMVPLATGSDMGGSLRNPAAFCGVVGFRPSPGLVPNETRGQAWSPLSVVGPMARGVADLCLMLGPMTAHDPRDPLSWPGPRAMPDPVDPASLRVAFSEDFGFAPVEAAIRRVFRDRVPRLSGLFAAAEEAAPDCAGSDEVFAVLRAVSFLGGHDAALREGAAVGPNIRANVEEGRGYSALDVARALAEQSRLVGVWHRFFHHHDILITPAIAISPRPWTELAPREIDGVPTRSYYHWLALAYAVTVAGLPAVCLPCGRDEAGMPFGVQIVGPRGGDGLVLGVALALEAALAANPITARPLPDIEALRRAAPIREMPGFLLVG